MKKQPNRRRLTRWLGTRAAALLGAGLPAVASVGCAQSVGDIDRTQPDLISKEHFRGQWFIRETVVDVPETLPGAFEGRQSSLESIVWDIQEDWLVGYRSYELFPGVDGQANTDLANPSVQPVTPGLGEGRDPSLYKGNPVVAYRISSHTDVQRGYNARTGEQNNVISENSSDRPWHEREFMRVDWASNGVDNIMMLQPLFGTLSTMSQYVPANEGGQDAFRLETADDGRANYIDFTVRRTMTPNVNGCFSAYFNSTIGDCAGEEVKIRTSMVKVDPEREQDYVPLVYDERRHGEFGFFRTERAQYDRDFGNTFSGLIQLAQRHEMWANSRDDSGEPKEYRARTLRPIVYTLSENYPDDLAEVTEEIRAEYDASFKEIAAAAREQSLAELEADLLADTGGDCLFCLDTNPDNAARMGDIRRNFLFWVDDVQASSPLGYGPSSANPETGRVVSANAYVYGAGVDRSAATAMQMIDLINGEIDDPEIQSGSFVRDQLASRRNPVDPRAAALRIDQFGEQANIVTEVLGADAASRLANLQQLGAEGFAQATPGLDQARIDALVDTPIEASMIPEEWLMMDQAQAPEFQYLKEMSQLQRAEDLARGLEPAPQSAYGYLSVSNWMGPRAVNDVAERQRIAAENNLWLEEFSDPVLIGLAKEMKDSELTGEQLKKELRNRIYRGVMLHELGHTFGLRHNFSASADALNYFDGYWDERVKSIQPVREYIDGPEPNLAGFLRSNCALTEPLQLVDGGQLDGTGTAEACQEQLDNQMVEKQYASIMDYGGRFNSDNQGLGYYDHAALASGYGDLVEVFTEDAMAGLAAGSAALGVNGRQVLSDANQVRTPILGQGVDEAMIFQGQAGGLHNHYSNYPALFGGHENLRSRRFMDRTAYYEMERDRGDDPLTPVKVPYLSCYDEFVDSVETCHRWDIGADAYEIVQDKLNSYEDYYVFNYFQRDRLGFSPWSVRNRTLMRYFQPLTNMYQHWLWGVAVTGRSPQGTPRSDLGFVAAQQGLNKLMNVMSTPAYGAHQFDEESGLYQPVRGECPEVTSMLPVQLRNAVDPTQFVEVPNCVDVPRGVGRSFSSRYDSSGYDVYRRVLEVGHFYDQLAAINALSASNASVVGIGSDIAAADSRTFRIPYNLVFEDAMAEMYSAIYSERDADYALRIFQPSEGAKGVVIGRDVFAPVDNDVMVSLPPIRPSRTYSTRVQALVNGMQMLDGSLNPGFAMRGQISLAGSGEERTAPADFEKVELTNPVTGRSYIAYRRLDGEGGPWYAADMLDDAREAIEAAEGEPGAINNVFGDVELVRLASSILGG